MGNDHNRLWNFPFEKSQNEPKAVLHIIMTAVHIILRRRLSFKFI